MCVCVYFSLCVVCKCVCVYILVCVLCVNIFLTKKKKKILHYVIDRTLYV
jgi:hypothetical protein